MRIRSSKKRSAFVVFLIIVVSAGIFIFVKPEVAGPQEASSTPTGLPSSVPRLAQSPTPTPLPPLPSDGGMWITTAEIMTLPTSGTAWDKMRTAAYGSWPAPDLKNQDNRQDISLLAGAF